MAKIIIPIIAILLLTGCITTPDLTTGADCWRYGVAEEFNTGALGDLSTVKVVKVKYDDLYPACDADPTEYLLQACYQPIEHTIYVHSDSKFYLYHEQCHVLLGRLHNACYPHYGIGKDESACDWNAGAKRPPCAGKGTVR